SMLTTTPEILGSAKTSILRRVTTTTFSHRGFLIRSCTMRPPTFPVAPSTIAEYSAFASVITSHPAEPQIYRCCLFGISHYYCPARSCCGVGVGICRFVPLPTCFRVADQSLEATHRTRRAPRSGQVLSTRITVKSLLGSCPRMHRRPRWSCVQWRIWVGD